MHSALTSAVARALGGTSVPLAAYYGITIGVPLINGSGSAEAAFLEHMVFVAIFPLTMVGLVAILGQVWRTGVAFRTRPRRRQVRRKDQLVVVVRHLVTSKGANGMARSFGPSTSGNAVATQRIVLARQRDSMELARREGAPIAGEHLEAIEVFMKTSLAHPETVAETTLVSYREEPAEPPREQVADAHSDAPAKSSWSGFHIPSLDGLRGGAFLLVFFGHALPAAMLRFVPPAFGVTVFFVLSGYLITTLLRREVDKSGTVSFRDFYLRRALRILPPFYIVLALSSTLTGLHVVEGQVTLPALGAYMLHAANYWHIYRGLDEIPGGTSVYWSLSVEEHFYLLFPLLYWGMRRWQLSARQQLGVILGLCGAVLAWRLVLAGVLHADHERLYRATDTRVDAILAGCALAVYGNPVLDRSRISDRTWQWVALPLGAVVLAATSLLRQPLFQEAFKGSLQAAALIPFFVVAIRCPKWLPMRFLNTKVMGFFGLLSYALYLSHRLILAVVEKWVTSNLVLQVPIALGTAVALCYALHVFVEVPCAELRKRLATPKGKRPTSKRMPTPMQPNIAIG